MIAGIVAGTIAGSISETKIAVDISGWGDLDGDGKAGQEGDGNKIKDAFGVAISSRIAHEIAQDMDIALDEKGFPKEALTEDKKKEFAEKAFEKMKSDEKFFSGTIEEDVLKEMKPEDKELLLSKAAMDYMVDKKYVEKEEDGNIKFDKKLTKEQVENILKHVKENALAQPAQSNTSSEIPAGKVDTTKVEDKTTDTTPPV